LPDGIFGDLDSLREDTKLFYEARGVKVSRNPDQDSTDFGKCMEYIATCDGTIDAISGSDTKDENKKLAVVAPWRIWRKGRPKFPFGKIILTIVLANQHI
jgi:hypothetical protein